MKKRILRLVYELIRMLAGGSRAASFLGVSVGSNCRMISRSYGTEPWLIKVGDRVTVAAGVVFLTHDGSASLLRDTRGRRYRYGRIEIGNDVFIGVNTVILPGVRIGRCVVVGAGSILTGSVPDGVLVAGNPARIIGKFADYERRGLRDFATFEQMKGRRYMDRIESVVSSDFRPEIKMLSE